MTSSNMPLFPGVSHFISLDKAKEMTKKYRDEKENILIRELRDMGIMPVCETFNREAFDTLLQEEGCVGLRIYPGMDEYLKIRLIIVGVNAKGEDILPSGSSSSLSNLAPAGDGNEIVEDGMRCPTICPPPSPLNE